MDDSKLTDALKKYFGHGAFRRPQEEIIASIVSGRDTLAIMPTGGGKSLCYQLPAMLLDGVTIVVSPLIALMKDQVDALAARSISAAMINSSQTWQEQCDVLKDLSEGRLKLAYVSPERFRANSFMSALRGVKISLFAIDEAHCISQWGHDFRPDYMRLGETIARLGRPVCAAFTATATPEVKADIAMQLKLREPAIFVSGFARENLSFNVCGVSSRAEKLARVKELADKYKNGIIYCATRKSAEALSQSLWDDGVRHVLYHGAMTSSERDAAQEKFMSGAENIAVATNAFGMGIDRANIRFVCHYELPGSVEALYQESGRAGRDGLPARCEMLLMYSDKRVQDFFIDGANPELPFIRNVYRVLRENADNSYECLMSIDDIAQEVADISRFEGRGASKSFSRVPKRGASGQNPMAVSSSISILRRCGFVDRFDVLGKRVRATRLLNPDADEFQLGIDPESLAEKRRRDEQKLRDVLRYAYSRECRQQWILKYFGELDNSPCGRCDVCLGGGAQASDFRELSAEELVALRKLLSGVARMSEKISPRVWRPRFGRDKIIKCLCGSKDAKIVSAGLERLSTYGILKDLGSKAVGELFKAAEEAGFVEIVDGEYPLAALTEAGADVMTGAVENVKMRPPEIVRAKPAKKSAKEKPSARPAELFGAEETVKISSGAKDADDSVSEADKLLYDELLKVRRRFCAILKGTPPFKIFPNSVLRDLAAMRPKTVGQAMLIKGIGEAKARRFLPSFLEAIAKHSD